MKIIKIFYPTSFLLLFLILFTIYVSSTALAASSPNFTETQISTSGKATSPDIYGDRIVWQDSRNGYPDIYTYNISTHQESQITTNRSTQSNPKIYGDRIVWMDWRNNIYSDVYMYDLSTHQETPIATNYTGEQNPDIYGDIIVWDANTDEGWQQIFMYNILTHQKTQVTSDNSNHWYPKIYGDKIVFDNGTSISMYNISTHQETIIATRDPDTFSSRDHADIFGNKIVWMDYRNYNLIDGFEFNYPEIYMYDLSTKMETRISTSESAENPDIYNNIIVWSDYRSGLRNYDIYMYDLSTSNETQITVNKSNQEFPAIYGNRIVWHDNRTGSWNIYMATLDSTPPVANFSTNVTNGYVPLTIQFTDLSQNAIAWNWNLGDGENSTQQNPIHTYTIAGNYTVNLTVSNANGTSSKLAMINVSGKTIQTSPVANFSSNITSGYAPLTVQFNDTSTETPTKWKWNFGDGTNSTLQNPVHTYSLAGNYTVTLTVNNSAASNTTTKLNYITIANSSNSLSADFSSSPISGKIPLTVSFTDKSSGSPTSWKWTFGDGGTSTVQNPVHTYNKTGLYSVTLTASKTGSSNSITKSSYIAVSSGYEAPIAAFSATPTSGSVPLTVSFTDQSTGSPTSWKWTFGDGGTSTGKSPVHTYNKTGQFTVALTATNANGSNTVTKTSYITVSNNLNAPIANFSAAPYSGKVPLTVSFTDQSSGSITSRKWTFGDGGNSTVQNPVYKYNKTGKFNVALTTTNAAGSNTVTKYSCINVTTSGTVVPNPVRLIPVTAFSATPSSGNIPLTVSFTDQSIGSPTSWRWTFGDGITSTDKSPVHVYNKTGQFSVTLTASNANGSNALTKTNYVIISSGSNVPVTNFSASPTSGSVPLNASFTDKTSGSVTSWKWSFGDGGNSSVQNPVYKYNKTGLYSVTLTTTNAGGSSALTKASYIAVSNSSKNPVAAFSASPVSGSVPLTVSFTDKSSGSPTSFKWTFGDGNTSTTQNPVYKYNKTGSFTVGLTVTNPGGSSTQTMTGYISVK